MTELIHVRIDLSVPGASMSHVAELEPVSATECEVRRIVELNSTGTVTGAGTDNTNVGMQAPALSVVPHPDLYADYPDIAAQAITATEFEVLWEEAVNTFPQLTGMSANTNE